MTNIRLGKRHVVQSKIIAVNLGITLQSKLRSLYLKRTFTPLETLEKHHTKLLESRYLRALKKTSLYCSSMVAASYYQYLQLKRKRPLFAQSTFSSKNNL